MQRLSNEQDINTHRLALMQYLNTQHLDAQAILGISRRSEPCLYEVGEAILTQGATDKFVYFQLTGKSYVRLKTEEDERILGEREAVSVLGEISFFNKTPATATVEVAPPAACVVMRISYDDFGDVIEEYPQVREILSRIGDMRIISQYNGFTSFKLFMDMIGWLRDRFAINRAPMPAFEYNLNKSVLENFGPHDRLLEVGDGPGVVCEVIYEQKPELLEHLYIQAARLEQAITDPHRAQPSDFHRGQYLDEQFEHIVALQVFNTIPPSRIDQQFEIASRLLAPGGHLFMVKLRLLNVQYTVGNPEPELLFSILDMLVERAWPDALAGDPLINTVFLDADLDPLMEWNKNFCEGVRSGRFVLPDDMEGEDRVMLQLLHGQAGAGIFDPDELHFEWLSWKGSEHGLQLEESEHRPELGYFFHRFRKPTS